MSDISVTFTGDEAKLVRSLVKSQKKMEKLEKAAEQVARDGKNAGDQTAKAMDRASRSTGKMRRHARGADRDVNAMTKSAGALLGRWLSIGAAVGAATTALREHNRISREAGNAVTATEPGFAKLAQIATSEQDLDRLIKSARGVFTAGGAATQSQASDVVFALESAGAATHTRFFSELFPMVAQPQVMADAAAAILTNFGQQETGGFRALVSKAFAASADSKTSAEQILEGASVSAPMAGLMGLSDEDVLAATARAAMATKSVEIGSTQVRSLIKELFDLQNRGEMAFESTTLVGMVNEMQRSLDERGLNIGQVFGRVEATSGFETVRKESGRIRSLVRELGEAERTDLAGQKIGLTYTSGDIFSSRAERQAVAQRQVAETRRGVLANTADAIAAAEIAAAERQGPIQRLGMSAMTGVRRFLMSDQNYIRSFGQPEERAAVGLASPFASSDDFPERLGVSGFDFIAQDREPIEALVRAAEALQEAARDLKGGPTLATDGQDR